MNKLNCYKFGGFILTRLNVFLKVFSDSPHISQIITGFIMLSNYGIINLKINYCKEVEEEYPTTSMIEATINNEIKVAYDMLDGYNFNKLKTDNYISNVDFYFKRSYNYIEHKDFKYAERIYPLGLNYHVTTKGNPIDNINLFSNLKSPKKNIKKIIKKSLWPHKRFLVEEFEDFPRRNSNKKILFMTRLWSPDGEKGENPKLLTEEVMTNRTRINTMRIECIDLLRNEFGDDFIGGLSPTLYTQKNYGKYIINKNMTKRCNYMEMMKSSDICIATTGLHNSTGWKLAEYVAASKAIVSEKINYALPGDFNNNQHYFEFETPDECVIKTLKLANNDELLYQMMCNNYLYYHNYVRPDRLVLNSLMTVIQEK